MSAQKEYRINEFITLKLEEGKTNIYVGQKLFNQCKGLLFINPHESELQGEINSIDEAQERLIFREDEESLQEYGICPEKEFMGHCSNLQAWAEYNYDTRILHSNLSFPLLKRLTKLGDKRAIAVFKEEIITRFFGGFENVSFYLEEEGYLEFLTKEDIFSLIESDTERDIIMKLDKKVNGKLKISLRMASSSFGLDKGKVYSLDIGGKRLGEVPEEIRGLRDLRDLDLRVNLLKEVPAWINELKELTYLELSGNDLHEIHLNLPNLVSLNLRRNSLESLSVKANHLKTLILNENNLSVLDFASCELDKLERLDVADNQIKQIEPHTFKVLRNLKKLRLIRNQLTRIPSEIIGLKHLVEINLSRNPLEKTFDQVTASTLMEIKTLKKIYITNEKKEADRAETVEMNGKSIIKTFYK